MAESNVMQGFLEAFAAATDFKPNPFHPLVWIIGEPEIGANVFIGAMSLINAKGALLRIGDSCDIATFVSINVADSHRRCLGLSDSIDRADIILENNVFVGTGAIIKGGAHVGHHSVIAAGAVVDAAEIPPYSLVTGNPMRVRAGYYRDRFS